MKHKAMHTALAWSDAITAALYFDRVIPANIPDTDGRDGADPAYYEVLQNLLPDSLRDPAAKIGIAPPMVDYVAHFLITFPQAVGIDVLPAGETLEEREKERLPLLLDSFGALLRHAREPDVAVFGVSLAPAVTDDESDPCLVLSNLDLVDTTRLSWKHVLELRKDRDAMERLRNLRRMVYKDYAGKPESFIREDIEFRMAEYEATTKMWGLPLQKGVLEIAMTGEALTAVGAAVALTLFGAPIAAAAAAGGMVAIGKAALAIAQRKREVELERKRNPMAYLVTLKGLERN